MHLSADLATHTTALLCEKGRGIGQVDRVMEGGEAVQVLQQDDDDDDAGCHAINAIGTR